MKNSKRNKANASKQAEARQGKAALFSKYALKNRPNANEPVDNKSLASLDRLLQTKRESV